MAVVNAVQMAHTLLLPRLQTAVAVLDATAGNGRDTLFLAKNTPPAAAVIAFDIQPQAIANTEILLKQHNLLAKTRLILDNHAHIASHVTQPLDAAMFNLGYLPGGDHAVSTCPATTCQAVSQILELLTAGGLITLAAYPGYEHGQQEYQAVHNYLASLDQKKFTVACWSMVNQQNNPPVLYIIEKRRSEKLESSASLKN